MVDFCELFCKGICHSLGSQMFFSLLKTLLKITNPVFVLVQGSRLFVTYTIIQGIISSEMEVRTGPLNGQCKKNKNKR